MAATSDLFNPVAAFIALRETLEAGIIIAVLLGFIEQIIPAQPLGSTAGAGSSRTELLPSAAEHEGDASYSTFGSRRNSERAPAVPPQLLSPSLSPAHRDSVELSDDEGHTSNQFGSYDREQLVRKLKAQVWSGALLGLAAAAIIGGIFLYVFYKFAHDLWQDAENLWEGIWCGVAAILILVMGIAFLRLPHARTKWRLKLLQAVEGAAGVDQKSSSTRRGNRKMGARAARGWILFGLPFITVLREGLEGVVFLGGIGLTGSPLSIFTGAVAGFVIGGVLAVTLFNRSESMSLQRFTIFSTVILFLMGAGLASRSAYGIERQYFINGVGAAAAEGGDGPGSFRVRHNIWKLWGCNPEPGHQGYSGFWQLAQSLVGWNNVGTYWTVGAYDVYWLIIIGTLIRLKYNEGRAEICGRRSERGWELEKARRRAEREEGEEEGLLAPHAEGSGSRRSIDE
ncbi:hypothetical protein CspeluHIS016_0204670 [Cutaneotrichosporon spelunceum]|uniref:Iron permease FTR1 n=1 Tax=Cutaneotrichosporon spelunceum TaxID=1672016 RepID=A0AAD3TRX7_9TREE|nr:hypothetical protein CspeluHIS016_0204670 [Cutaneotrichosporon spelunceum]